MRPPKRRWDKNLSCLYRHGKLSDLRLCWLLGQLRFVRVYWLDSFKSTDKASEQNGGVVQDQVGDFNDHDFRGSSAEHNRWMAGMDLGGGDVDLEVVVFGGEERIVHIECEFVLGEATFSLVFLVVPVEIDCDLGNLDLRWCRIEFPCVLHVFQECVCELEVADYYVLDADWQWQFHHGWRLRKRHS